MIARNWLTTNTSSPVAILKTSSYSQISTGQEFSTAIDSLTGNIWSWGRNDWGQLGDNGPNYQWSPVQLARTASYIAVSSGDNHTLALDASTGNIWSWGKNDSGQLGDNTVMFKRSPVVIARTGSYIAIAAGQSSSYAVDNTGLIFGWGLNTSGELGNYSITSYSSPVVIAKVSL
jgi:alpha-tubulin suppressor-like RCC1 family protein